MTKIKKGSLILGGERRDSKSTDRGATALKVFLEAEAHNGPSLIICYRPCTCHGYDLSNLLEHQKMTMDSDYWTLLRYNPTLPLHNKCVEQKKCHHFYF